MKVKFKKKLIDVDRNNSIMQLILVFTCMLVVSIVGAFMTSAEASGGKDDTVSVAVEETEYEDETSSETEIRKTTDDFIRQQVLLASVSSNQELLLRSTTSLLNTEEKHEREQTNIPEDINETTASLETSVADTHDEESTNDTPQMVQAMSTTSEPIILLNGEEIPIDVIDNPIQMASSKSPREIGPGIDILEEEIIPEEVPTIESAPITPEKEYWLNLSENEKEILCRIVEAEVTGTGKDLGCSDAQALEAKMRVARVIINRVLSPSFPNSIEGVVFQKRQFSPIADGRYYKVSICDLTREAVEMALDKSVPDDIPNALYFRVGRWTNSWERNSLCELMTDAVGHTFYSCK